MTAAHSNERLPSTRWVSKTVRVPAPPEGPGTTPAKPSSSARLSRHNPRVPLSMTVTYRGGPEAWYQISARGRIWRFPGHVALHDAIGVIFEGTSRGREVPPGPK